MISVAHTLHTQLEFAHFKEIQNYQKKSQLIAMTKK